MPIDIGGDGTTDFVSIGRAILQGSEYLYGPIPVTEHILNVLVQDGPSEWRVAQEVPLSGTVRKASPVDLDGDGLEDLIVTVFADQRLMLRFYRQTLSGSLDLDAESLLSEQLDTWSIYSMGNGSGRVLAIHGGDPLRGIAFELDPPSFRVLWSAPLKTPYGYVSEDAYGILPTSAGGILLTSTYFGPRIGVAVSGDGWGRSFPIPVDARDTDEFLFVRRRGDMEAWCWAASSIDTLRRLLPTPSGDSLMIHATAIRGLPPLSVPNTHNKGLAIGAAIYFSTTWEYIEGTGRNLLIEVDQEGEALVVQEWPQPAAWYPGLLMTDWEGRLQFLSWNTGIRDLVPASGLPPGEGPDRPIAARSAIAGADFDRDGLLDVVLEGEAASGPRPLWLLRGLPLPPWFGSEEQIGSARPAGRAATTDLDDDGDLDLLIGVNDLGRSAFVPFFWEGNTLRTEDAQRIPVGRVDDLTRIEAGDFDGDGRHEVLHETQILRWGSDRLPDPPVDISEGIRHVVAVEDLDGDGSQEIIHKSSASELRLARLDPLSGMVTTLQRLPVTGWWSGLGALCDPEGTGSRLFYWRDEGGGSLRRVLDSGPGLGPPVDAPPAMLWNFATAQGLDLDSDGRDDLVITPDHAKGYFEVIMDPLEGWGDHVWTLPERLGLGEMLSLRVPGWADIDGDGDLDLAVTTSEGIHIHWNETLADPAPSSTPLIVRATWHNPSRDEIRFAARTGRASTLLMDLFDVQGRRLWSLARPAEAGEWTEVRVGQEIQHLTSGTYFVSISADRSRVTRRIVILR